MSEFVKHTMGTMKRGATGGDVHEARSKAMKEAIHFSSGKKGKGKDKEHTYKMPAGAAKKVMRGSSGGGFKQGLCVNCDKPTKSGKCSRCN